MACILLIADSGLNKTVAGHLLSVLTVQCRANNAASDALPTRQGHSYSSHKLIMMA